MQGSVAATANSSGTILGTDGYVEFGSPTAGSTATNGWLGSYELPADGATGSIVMGMRVYNPNLGRFLEVDPLPGASANAYDYVDQSPLNSVDPTGMMPIGCVSGACAAWQEAHQWAVNRHCKEVFTRYGAFRECGTPPPYCTSASNCGDKIVNAAIACLGVGGLAKGVAVYGLTLSGAELAIKAIPVVGWLAGGAGSIWGLSHDNG